MVSYPRWTAADIQIALFGSRGQMKDISRCEPGGPTLIGIGL